MSRKKTKKIKAIGFLIILLPLILFFVLSNKNTEIKKESSETPPTQTLNTDLSPISGLPCKNYNRRPFAIMLAGDEVARPLSGLQSADLVVEMPVLISGMNRLMAVYVCGNPEEIGSVRSARHDFIPLAMGLDAIFAHWGGSSFALDKLNAGIMDNIDALLYSQTAFWRQSGIPAPHNGFTSIEKLTNQANKLNYRMENKFEGYPHKNVKIQSSNVKSRLIIGYPDINKVWWDYNPETNEYARWRGSKEEKDYNSNLQVKSKNIVVMRANSRFMEDQYIDVDIEGEGTAEFYLNGQKIEGTWKKEGSYQPTKLYFYDNLGKEIEFVPGQIWIEVIEPDKIVTYEEIK
ncbi:MAG: DUF3048 domain-containing protein [Candidatus Paceibacterota bacterium]|jgi:hypothetical protein